MYIFSATMHNTVMKLGQWVVWDNTFQNMYVKMTLKGQGHTQHVSHMGFALLVVFCLFDCCWLDLVARRSPKPLWFD